MLTEFDGYVLVDVENKQVRGGLLSVACLYTEAGAKRTLEQFTRESNRVRWAIKPAKLVVEE